jgi:hypothetical protein
MAKQVNYKDIDDACRSAGRLGFQKSVLLLEGLMGQLQELESAMPPLRQNKARNVITKIELIRSALEHEHANENEEWFGWQRMNIALGGSMMSIVMNGACALAAYGACEMFRLQNLKPGIAIFAVFAVVGIVKSVGESIRSSRPALIRRIGDTLSSLEELVGECLSS